VVAAHGNADRCRSRRGEAAAEFRSGARALAKRLEEWDVEVGAVLLRARNRGLRLRDGFTSVAMRWWLAERGSVEPWRTWSGTARGSYSGDQGYSDAWGGGEQEVDCGVDGRAAAMGEVLRRRQRWQVEEQRVFRGRRRGGKVQGLVWKT
jgi:hypothetical protein